MENDKIVNKLKNKFKDQDIEIQDLYSFYQRYDKDLKKSTFRWRVHRLKEKGVLYSVGRGVYKLGDVKEYMFNISDEMVAIYKLLHDRFEYSEIIIWNTRELANYMRYQPTTNLTIVEVDEDTLDSAYRILNERYNNVYVDPDKKSMEYYVDGKESVIIIKKLLVEAPVNRKIIGTPKIEKVIVDLFMDIDLFKTYQGNELLSIYNELFTRYSINHSTLGRYLNRRRSKERFSKFIKEHSDIKLGF